MRTILYKVSEEKSIKKYKENYIFKQKVFTLERCHMDTSVWKLAMLNLFPFKYTNHLARHLECN